MPSLRALKSLLRLCELPDPELSADHLRQVPDAPALIAAGALREAAFPNAILVPYHHEDVCVDIEPDAYSAETGRLFQTKLDSRSEATHGVDAVYALRVTSVNLELSCSPGRRPVVLK